VAKAMTRDAARAATMSATRRWLLLGAAILALFAGACTLFAGVVTAVELWRTHVQAQWPTAVGTVDTCDITYPSTGPRRKRQYIRCRFSYSTESGPATATLTSAYFPAVDVPQYPANQQQPFVDWVNDHLPGTHVALRYNPEDHRQVILADNYMPRGGPRTQDNVKLLATFAGLFVVAMVMARVLRPRDAAAAP
jgi:hypothetical protein